jgi:hypothetical protein
MTHQEAEAFLKNVDQSAPFWEQAGDDKAKTMATGGGKTMKHCIYNLIVTRRDVKLWAKFGMKPHYGWKITDVKNYFGIKGNKHKISEQIEAMCDSFLA